HAKEDLSATTVGRGRDAPEAPRCLLVRDFRYRIAHKVLECRTLMCEPDMAFVEEVLEVLKPVAGTGIDLRRNHFRAFPLGVPRELRGFAFAEEDKDHAKIFFRRVSTDPDILFKAFGFEGLINALAVRAVGPAMVGTPDVVTFDPAAAQQGSSVSASILDAVDLAVLASVDGKVL